MNNLDVSKFGTPEFFDQFSTGQLLRFLKISRKSGRYWFDDFGTWTVTTESIKEALSGREHVLNKKERKELRLKNKKQKRDRQFFRRF